MQTIESLKAEQAKKLAELEAELALSQKFADAGLPLPDSITGNLRGATYANFRNVGGLTEALNLFESFKTIIPFNVLKNGFTMLTPESIFPEKDRDRGYKRDAYKNADYACMLEVRHIPESPAPTSAELVFFARVQGTAFKVSIKFGKGYIGACEQLAPVAKVSRNSRTGRTESVYFEPNAMVHAMTDGCISFASGDMGPIKKSANHNYLFVSDHGDDECSPADCSHAVAMLRNMAGLIGE